MPQVKSSRVSVVYDVGNAEDAWVLNVTFPSVIHYFPDALEVIVVVQDDIARSAFEGVLRGFEIAAPFELQVALVEYQWTPSTSGMETSLSSLSIDKFCSGSFVLHLDVDSVLLERVTYDSIFHFGKPVIPFRRLSYGEQQPG